MVANFEMTMHASIRAQQRGIRLRAIQLVVDHGDGMSHVGKGGVAYWLSHRKARKLSNNGLQTLVVEEAQGIIVLAQGNHIVTVTHQTDMRGKRYRREHRNGSRTGRSRRRVRR
jgi:hypothetical protein